MNASRTAGLGHTRLSIIDLSTSARQPMSSWDGRYWISFNGEIYNYLELRSELADYPFRTRSDTEVILAAYRKWGAACLDRFLGMFAFLIWDEQERRLFAARDRFGVKPLHYYCRPDGSLLAASEIKALHAAGVPRLADEVTWASYLTYGAHHRERTFWQDIQSLPGGHILTWQAGDVGICCWYDPAERCGQDYDGRPVEEVCEEYTALLVDSVRLRFRSDVPVGINLSGGLDSSVLFGLVQRQAIRHSEVKAFTFTTGDERYDELPWVHEMLCGSLHKSVVCRLGAAEVPELAERVQNYQDEPYGGVPTLAYGKLFEQARAAGVIVLLDGQGMDEQWAGYDYYRKYVEDDNSLPAGAELQGARDATTKPDCLVPEFRERAIPLTVPQPFPDALRNAQYRDLCYTKLPRALRFNDRISMMASTELREPFLDHRLVELALRQPPERKIGQKSNKLLLRRIAGDLCPRRIRLTPKRPLQTPQREWLLAELADWAHERLALALELCGTRWLDPDLVHNEQSKFWNGKSDNSFYIWQWTTIPLLKSAYNHPKRAALSR
jgi:asparagine synthase (glutamine-hydrolysing)